MFTPWVACRGSDESAEAGAGLGQQVVDTPTEEFYGLGFKLPLPRLIGTEDGLRAGPKAAVVEEGSIGAQEEFVASARPGQIGRRVAH
jgi:hypothetical protein